MYGKKQTEGEPLIELTQDDFKIEKLICQQQGHEYEMTTLVFGDDHNYTSMVVAFCTRCAKTNKGPGYLPPNEKIN